MAHRLPLADIQFISDFAAFCRTKGDEAYTWTLPHACALGQFGHAGICTERDCKERGVPYSAFAAAALQGLEGLYTFSALADRLEALLTDAPEVVGVS